MLATQNFRRRNRFQRWVCIYSNSSDQIDMKVFIISWKCTTYRRGPHAFTPFTQRMKYNAVMAPFIMEGTIWKNYENFKVRLEKIVGMFIHLLPHSRTWALDSGLPLQGFCRANKTIDDGTMQLKIKSTTEDSDCIKYRYIEYIDHIRIKFPAKCMILRGVCLWNIIRN